MREKAARIRPRTQTRRRGEAGRQFRGELRVRTGTAPLPAFAPRSRRVIEVEPACRSDSSSSSYSYSIAHCEDE